MKAEPAITVASITAVVTAILSVLVVFGLPLSGDQQGVIVGAVGVVAAVVIGIITRTKVTPTDTVIAVKDKTGTAVAGPAAAQATGSEVDVVKKIS